MEAKHREPPSDGRWVLLWYSADIPPRVARFSHERHLWLIDGAPFHAEALWWADIPAPFVESASPDLLAACVQLAESCRLAGIHQTPDGELCPWYSKALADIAKSQETV